jgi:hypothetical protein
MGDGAVPSAAAGDCSVTLFCSNWGKHRRKDVLIYVGPVPVPEGVLPYMGFSELILECPCRRCPLAHKKIAPGEDRLRAEIDRIAATPARAADISKILERLA